MGLLRRLRRKRILNRGPNSDFAMGLSAVRHLRQLDPDRRERVIKDARVFAAETRWEGVSGFKVSDSMKAVVSAVACLLVCDTRQTLYEDVSSVILHPAGYRAASQAGPQGIVTEGVGRLGEAHFHGPIVLSWADSLRDATQPTGRNLVLHEFAHKLDMLDGMVDGTPPLPESIPLDRWVDTMTTEYDSLHGELIAGVMPTLHPYAATNPGEFFAVSTESYFERPIALRHVRPALYDLLKDYYVVGG
ncbi:MAG: M90 family metallopeptidase [Phycisphaerae bacterium]|nr:M90 family metallopeptidase [Phycisphaerae bacterium]